MGCLKKLIKIGIVILAVIGFVSIGGKDYVMNWCNNYTNPPQDEMLKRAQKVGDFSKIGDEYEIDKAASALGYSGVLAEHKASGQKMIVVDSGKKPLLTTTDFYNNSIDKKLDDLSHNMQYQFITVEDLKVTQRGYIKAFGKQTPYVKFTAKVKKLPIGEVSGIISAVETKNGEPRIIISANEKNRYSQIISEDFFSKVK